MLILFDGIMAVHETVNGIILWKKYISQVLPRDHERKILPFITDTIAGYLYSERSLSRDIPGLSLANIYDTNTGAFIASMEISPSQCQLGYWAWDKALTKGPFLCCADKTAIRVIKVTKQVAKLFEFALSKEKLASIKERIMRIEKLLGFVGKSNILLGWFKLTGEHRDGHALFHLDLDAACKAKNQSEVDQAFSFTFFERPEDLQHEFQPIYRTDRARGSIDLVGTMRRRVTDFLDEKMNVSNWYFVTELQLQRD